VSRILDKKKTHALFFRDDRREHCGDERTVTAKL
jgi:hypothetical protein